jgi:hypothetical protein
MQNETQLFQKMSPYDRHVYIKGKVVMKKVVELEKMWKLASSSLERKTTKNLLIKLMNEEFESIPKTCAFLGVINPPYTFSMLKKDITAIMEVILENYEPKKDDKQEDVAFYLLDDMEIWRIVNH